jgi:dienelactone hydrolase
MRHLVAFALFLLSTPALAGLVEEDGFLPAVIAGRTVRLEALVVRPDDGARHPLAVLSHGAPREAGKRPDMHPRSRIAEAREFARRGWVAVVAMRRGYGLSEGDYAESSGRCDSPDYERAGRASAEDIRAVIAAMAARPYVDASTVLGVGQSAGGLATVALTADPPPGLVAAINFAGGRGSSAPDQVCSADRLVAAFGVFGRSSRVPMLWVYADNDHYFGPALAQRFHAAFTAAGGQARFVAAPAFRDDGHGLFSKDGIPLWTRTVDDFLAERRLTQIDKPMPMPTRTDVAFPRGLDAEGRAAFLAFLDAPTHKAFATSPSGAWGWRSGRRDAETAAAEALESCSRHSRTPCSVVTP